MSISDFSISVLGDAGQDLSSILSKFMFDNHIQVKMQHYNIDQVHNKVGVDYMITKYKEFCNKLDRFCLKIKPKYIHMMFELNFELSGETSSNLVFRKCAVNEEIKLIAKMRKCVIGSRIINSYLYWKDQIKLSNEAQQDVENLFTYFQNHLKTQLITQFFMNELVPDYESVLGWELYDDRSIVPYFDAIRDRSNTIDFYEKKMDSFLPDVYKNPFSKLYPELSAENNVFPSIMKNTYNCKDLNKSLPHPIFRTHQNRFRLHSKIKENE